VPVVAAFEVPSLRVTPHRVIHTSHPTYGYLIETEASRIVWAPEFFRFPAWAAGADLMFAEAAAYHRPIQFAGGVGGHMPVLTVALQAQRAGIHRLVFAHIGRPTLRALDSGLRPPFGEFAKDGQVFYVRGQ
jgi:ribonuclease BN (tRNA processing enzyme)